MGDLFADAAVWLDQQRRDHLSRSVRFLGYDGLDITLLAAIGSSQYESANEYGAIERWESRDYIVTRKDLPRMPAPGDTIVEERDGDNLSYAVSAPRGMPVWTPADSYGLSISIHTALV